MSALIQLEALLDLVRDVVHELEGLVLGEDAPPVMLRGKGRGERSIVGIPIENTALTLRLVDRRATGVERA